MDKGQHIINIEDLTRADIEQVLTLADRYEKKGIPTKALKGKIVASAFFEPSTRTRLSFEAAAHRLGADVISIQSADSTSLKKGESYADTGRMLASYADLIVTRSADAGSAQEMAGVVSVPIINAGDGPHQHPTQTLIDLFAIQKTQGQVDGLTIALVGDLKYGRVLHSLAKALTYYSGVKQIWVAPESLTMPDEVRDVVRSSDGELTETTGLEAVIPQADIIVIPRMQQERFESKAAYEKVKDAYVLTVDMLIDAKENMRILSPLPRLYELPAEIDTLTHAYYFEQAAGGVPVRAALLNTILGA